jgi:RND family efflux transporter MFP subunit
MKRGVKWFAGLAAAVLVLGAIALLAARAVGERRAAAQAGAAPKAPAPLALSAADIVTLAGVEMQRTVEVSGTVRAADSAYVKARVAAEIRRIAVREGDAVKAGQLLVEQDTTEFDWRVRQADQQAAAARAQLEIAQRQLANNKALVAQGFISPTALETSVSNEAGAQANLQAALAALEIARKARADASLRAPIAGFVAQRLAQPGERVAVDARILEIVDLSRLEIEAALPSEDVALLRVGSPARLTVDGIAAPVGAKVVRINPSAQAGSRAVPVYLAVDAHPALRHGLFARGRIEVERRRAAALPATAVRTEGTRAYVQALQGERIVARPVETGLRADAAGVEMVEITKGLPEGARVLVGSVGVVRDGTPWKMSAANGSPSAPAAATP